MTASRLALVIVVAAGMFQDAAERSFGSDSSHAFMYHWIYTLRNLGRNDTGVTADYPIVNVFQNAEARDYAVYNYQATPLTVRFSDGTEVLAKPRTLTPQRGS